MTDPEDRADEERPGPDIRRLTVLMPLSMYADLRLEAEDARQMIGEHIRDVVRTHLAMTECEECGKDVPGDALFCPYCKTEFEEPESEDEDEESEKED